jgi:hypothetical protein
VPGPEHSEISFPDAVQLFRSFARVAERSQTLVLDFLMRAPEFSGLRMADQRVGEAFFTLTAKMLSDRWRLPALKSTSGPSMRGSGPHRPRGCWA